MNDVDWTTAPEWAIGVGYSHKHGDWLWFDHGHYMDCRGGVTLPFNTSFTMDEMVGIQLTCDKQMKHNVEWNGESEDLPPVGTECQMFMDGHLIGDQVLIMGYFDVLVWVTVQNWYDDGSYSGVHQTFSTSNVKFQSIRSDKEKLIDELCSYLEPKITDVNLDLDCSAAIRTTIELICEALISGELPLPKGVKK